MNKRKNTRAGQATRANNTESKKLTIPHPIKQSPLAVCVKNTKAAARQTYYKPLVHLACSLRQHAEYPLGTVNNATYFHRRVIVPAEEWSILYR